jgi:hypothetical protein
LDIVSAAYGLGVGFALTLLRLFRVKRYM